MSLVSKQVGHPSQKLTSFQNYMLRLLDWRAKNLFCLRGKNLLKLHCLRMTPTKAQARPKILRASWSDRKNSGTAFG